MRLDLIDNALRDEMIDCILRRNVMGAKRLFATAMENSTHVSTLSTIYRYIPAVYFHFERTQAWSRLYFHLNKLIDTADPDHKEHIYFLKIASKLCIRDYKGFIADYNSFKPLANLDIFENIAARIISRNFPNFTDPKIFCIGLSRTGTTSLHDATQILGFRSAHFFNPITCTALAEDDFYLFDAFSDTPVCVSFERLYYRFPNSRFILSTRNKQDWIRSMGNLSLRTRRTDKFEHLRQFFRFSSVGFLPQYELFDYELYYQYESLEAALSAYTRRVDSFFTGERESRLLRVDLSADDTWDRLCTFLSVPKPTVPFPHSNTTPKPDPA